MLSQDAHSYSGLWPIPTMVCCSSGWRDLLISNGNDIAFCRLVSSPESSPKIWSVYLVTCSSSSTGLINKATSSAYKGSLCLESGYNSSSAPALTNWLLSTSMTRINNIGDKGSPSRSPYCCWMTSRGSPFNKMWIDEVDSKLEIRWLRSSQLAVDRLHGDSEAIVRALLICCRSGPIIHLSTFFVGHQS
jgi:hypothetical protein